MVVMYPLPLKRYHLIPTAARDPRATAVAELVRAMIRLLRNALHSEGLSKISFLYQINEALSHTIPLALFSEKKVTIKRGMKRKMIVMTSMKIEKEKPVLFRWT